jgi:hypothetical protein
MSTDDMHHHWTTPEQISPEEQAMAITRAGALVSGLVLLGYVIQLVAGLIAGRETTLTYILADLISLGFAGLLIWRVWAIQVLWAAALAGVFFAAEFAAQLDNFRQGLPTGGLMIMFATLATACGVSAFGAWRLGQLHDEEM